MKFKRYPSIENSYREKTIQEIKKHGFDLYLWVVTNKVHGANLSLWYDGKEIKVGKRTSFLGKNDNFYNFQRIVEKYKESVISLFNKFKETNEYIVVYGEIFGGSYNHPDVSFNKNSSKVQKGVDYIPYNDFYAFDIYLSNSGFVNFSLFCELCEEFGFIYAKPLFKGSFDDCLNFNPIFQDPIYKEFGLPEIKDNYSEGVVLKPENVLYFNNSERCILKNKNPKFKEIQKKKKRVKKEISEHLKKIIESVSQYVTENRLKNVLSHGYEIGQKDFGKLMKLFVTDIIDDYEKDNGSLYKGIEDKKEKKVINKLLNKMCSDLIRPNFMNIIDGEF